MGACISHEPPLRSACLNREQKRFSDGCAHRSDSYRVMARNETKTTMPCHTTSQTQTQTQTARRACEEKFLHLNPAMPLAINIRPSPEPGAATAFLKGAE